MRTEGPQSGARIDISHGPGRAAERNPTIDGHWPRYHQVFSRTKLSVCSLGESFKKFPGSIDIQVIVLVFRTCVLSTSFQFENDNYVIRCINEHPGQID